MPHRAFRNIDGFWSDSTEVKVSLPEADDLSSLELTLRGVTGKCIVDLLNEKRDKVLRSYTIGQDAVLAFPYLKEGRYSVRINEDRNRNGIVDTGSVLEHRQPERVAFLTVAGSDFLQIPKSVDLVQEADLKTLFQP